MTPEERERCASVVRDWVAEADDFVARLRANGVADALIRHAEDDAGAAHALLAILTPEAEADRRRGQAVRSEITYLRYGPDPVADMLLRADRLHANGHHTEAYLLRAIAAALREEGGGK